ncbi:MAG: TatD family hydrolase [Candidatus Aenigmatarchaeota archaeon]
MIDSHCHLESKQFDGDREEVIEKAKDRVNAIVDSCAEINEAKDVIELHRNHKEFVFPSVGLHPKRAVKASKQDLEDYKSLIRRRRNEIVAVGEVGLDHAQVKHPKRRKKAKEIFADFVELSNDLELPVVVHARNAVDEALRILRKHKEGDVVFHCFAGNVKQLKEALEEDYYISLGGIIFRNEKKYERLIDVLPHDNLLLETDAPYLARKKSDRSEPWFIWDVAEKIAEVKGRNFQKVWKTAGENAKEVFNLPIDI